MASPGQLLREAREAAGRSVVHLAREVGMSEAMVRAIETGERVGSIETWRRLCAVLAIDPREVLAPHLEDEETEVEDTPCSPSVL